MVDAPREARARRASAAERDSDRARAASGIRGEPAAEVLTFGLGPAVSAHAWRFTESKASAARPAAHPAVELAWVEEGRAIYEIAGRACALTQGQVVVVPAFVEHRTILQGPMRACSLHLGLPRLDEIADAMGCPRDRLAPGLLARPDAVLGVGALLGRELRAAERGSAIAVEGLLEALGVALLREAPEPARSLQGRPVHPRVRAALQRIDDDLTAPLTVELLAREARMTRFGFTRLFREQIGVPPYRYLIGRRLERAATLLRDGRAAVAEAACAVGFNDLGRFGVMFRRRFGCTPSAFAKRSRIA
jgi:AraC-like DNA-binding protein/quercetin dioxygenase-like cupin family protein